VPVNYQAWMGVPNAMNSAFAAYKDANKLAREQQEAQDANSLKLTLAEMKSRGGAGGGGSLSVPRFEQTLFSDYNKRSAGFENAKGYYSLLENAYKAGGPNGDRGDQDLALIYAYIKMLDPNSVVREGEVGLNKEALGYYSMFKNFVDRILKGDKSVASMLAPGVRNQMYAFARKGMVSAAKKQKLMDEVTMQRVGKYEPYGVDLNRTIPSRSYDPTQFDESFNAEVAGAPKMGQVTMPKAGVQETLAEKAARLEEMRRRREAAGVVDEGFPTPDEPPVVPSDLEL
jgi:hypothetical protein